jgi:hypothetical protein
MSHYFSSERNFKHTYDCEIGGCPGHVMQIEYASTSDTIHILIDNKIVYTFTDNVWYIMLLLAEEMTT